MVQASMVTMEGFSLSLVLVGSAVVAAYLCVAAWVSWPRRVGEIFRRQGIDGPPPSSFWTGNLSEMQARQVQAGDGGGGGTPDFQKDGFDDYCKRIFPYFDKWRKAYGMYARKHISQSRLRQNKFDRLVYQNLASICVYILVHV